MPTSLYYAIAFVVVSGIAMWIYQQMTTGKRVKEFLANHPDAAKVMLRTTARNLLKMSSVTIEEVDGNKPILTNEGMTGVLLLTPGRHKLSMYAQYDSALSKNNLSDTKTMWVEVVAHGVYSISYDSKEDVFLFNTESN